MNEFKEITMFAFPEHFSHSAKAGLDAQLALMASLTNKTFESVEKFIDLNLNVARSSLAETSNVAKQLMTAKDPQEFFSLTSSHAKPNAEKALAYSREVATLASHVQAEFSKAAEEQFTEANRKVLSLVEEVSKNAPAGSENAVAVLKSMIGNANASYEQLAKTTKQSVEAMESNMSQAMTQFTHAAEKAMPKAKK
jgi:phasin family protein